MEHEGRGVGAAPRGVSAAPTDETGVVVDASVAIEWLVAEPGSHLAAGLLEGRPLHAPALMRIEAANALRVMGRRGVLTPDEADDALATLGRVPLASAPPGFDPVPRAVRLARLLDHPVYDCVYLSLAVDLGRPVVTADRRFVAAAAAAHPDRALLVHSLNAPAGPEMLQ